MRSLLELSATWYRGIAEWATSTPEWVHGLALFGTQALLGVFAALAVLAWWRVDRRPFVLIAPLVAAPVSWFLSELIKDQVQQLRPCRALPIPGGTIENCADVSNWSLPSSHSAAAAAFAIALSVLWRRITELAVVLALLEGFSRIFIGVHYPHDVLAGFALGAVVGAVSVWRIRGERNSRPDRTGKSPAHRTA
ncbi:phosphatase PAP2 family protein [Saccharopolyspora sp. K220]|uniref:phosphatase PAP2 family protein n=1 Tax=Saccharopolyspora soli TaxID=2926618 RepID=UPI001F593F60|nr:phosphatase PAP2 family protein [Saccharopolyspora soli]MCI2421191.1 phosphatase PAP2 family protein [Saccharopolyspora soli]